MAKKTSPTSSKKRSPESSQKKKTSSASTKKQSTSKRPDINNIRSRIREICRTNNYNEEILLEFAEFVNGGKFKPVEPSMQELKDAVIEAFGYSSYAELSKDGSFSLFVKSNSLKMINKDAWLKVYRKFVGLPESEKDSIGVTSINGVDVLRNFLPWKVFDLNPKDATAEDIKAAFNKLAKEHHPDYGGNPEVFERLKNMRDSILSAYK